MREIKFRAWHKAVKEMIPVGTIEFFKGGKPVRVNELNEAWHSNDIILMQYTGLRDNNGKEIYEGDLMKWPDEQQELGFVQYEENGCQFRIAFKSEYSTSCHIGLNIGEKGQAVVVGNIYENPDLLSSDTNDEPSVATEVK